MTGVMGSIESGAKHSCYYSQEILRYISSLASTLKKQKEKVLYDKTLIKMMAKSLPFIGSSKVHGIFFF